VAGVKLELGGTLRARLFSPSAQPVSNKKPRAVRHPRINTTHWLVKNPSQQGFKHMGPNRRHHRSLHRRRRLCTLRLGRCPHRCKVRAKARHPPARRAWIQPDQYRQPAAATVDGTHPGGLPPNPHRKRTQARFLSQRGGIVAGIKPCVFSFAVTSACRRMPSGSSIGAIAPTTTIQDLFIQRP
jgi:hypothetical protein